MLCVTKSMRRLFLMSVAALKTIFCWLIESEQVHFHIIPAPKFGSSHGVESTDEAVGGKAPLTHREMVTLEGQARLGELDEDEAKELLGRIRARL